jgi:hypothetical protein
MDSYESFGSPGRNREGDPYAARAQTDSYRRRSPGKYLRTANNDLLKLITLRPSQEPKTGVVVHGAVLALQL